MEIIISPELLREATNKIKELATLRNPQYELPADSFIERCAKELIELGWEVGFDDGYSAGANNAAYQ